jgi:hypothetical protein
LKYFKQTNNKRSKNLDKEESETVYSSLTRALLAAFVISANNKLNEAAFRFTITCKVELDLSSTLTEPRASFDSKNCKSKSGEEHNETDDDDVVVVEDDVKCGNEVLTRNPLPYRISTSSIVPFSFTAP